MRMTALVALLSLSCAAGAQERLVERVPTPFVEGGKAVTLEVVVFRPAGAGPFPAVLFNHGSTGMGNDPAKFRQTSVSAPIARVFNQRGWLVAFLQRRGRGSSDGLYDEGFDARRTRYTCETWASLAGMQRALEDVDAGYAWLKERPDVDGRRILVGGQSRGGILSLAYAASRPGRVIGAVNFVGGWTGESACPTSIEDINTATFRKAASFPGPTLWIYGENDTFYGMAHSRKNFDAFTGAGGKGTFLAVDPGPGRNGHYIGGTPELWREALTAYLKNFD